ncbi:MAG: hypothetical protein JWN79_3226 [Gemmatimonadetes bacterium]|jgi:hypothetical protein|nr:hypothetical protein [Gemmatimonadota bacterium]
MADNERNDFAPGSTSRTRHRDNDDVRDPMPAGERNEVHPDSRSEARGDARENVGNTARGTAAEPRDGGNDRTKHGEQEPFDDRVG